MAKRFRLGEQLKKLRFKPGKKGILIALAAVAAAAVLTFALVTYSQVHSPETILLNSDFDFDLDVDVNKEFSNRIVNIALIGYDRDRFRERYTHLFLPDMIMVASIDFEHNTVKFVRVPRDTYVPIYGTQGVKDKINHSYFHGYSRGSGGDRDEAGLRTTLQTISHLLGDIPIHYHFTVCMDAVIQLVDTMGGVHYDVEDTLYDHSGNVLIHKGPQQLDGINFLAYVRHRDDSTGQDIGRIDRQMNLLMATFHYFKEQDRFKYIPVTYRVYKDYVNTNLSYMQIAALALYARDFEVTEESVQFFSLNGGGQSKDGIYYYVPYQDQRVSLIKQVFGLTAARWPTEVLRDTPPPAMREFIYILQEGEDGKPAILLSWVPGDSKPVTYHLFRRVDDGEEELLAKDLEETTFLDSDVTPGHTYVYRLVAYHYRADGPPAGVTVSLDEPEINVTGVSLNKMTLALQVGDTFQLTAAVKPADAKNNKVTWSSSNPAAVTVSDGMLTALGEGFAVITVKTEDGEFTASCEVTVQPSPVDPGNGNGGDEPPEEDPPPETTAIITTIKLGDSNVRYSRRPYI